MKATLDRAGQWDVDGRAHLWDVTAPFATQAIRTTAGRGLPSCWSMRGRWCSSTLRRIFTRRRAREHHRAVDAVLLHAYPRRPHPGNRRPAAAELSATNRTNFRSTRVQKRPRFCARCFHTFSTPTTSSAGLAQLELRPIDGPVDVFGVRFEPVILIHGETQINGYRFGSAAYLTDHSEIPESSMDQLRGLDILFLDALRHKPHPTHSTVKNSLAIVDRVKPKRAFFTHICHDLGMRPRMPRCRRHVRLSYDGMKLEFEI